MKRILLFLMFIYIWKLSYSQNVGIGTTAPNNGAILDVQSTDKGILFPRLSTAQRNAIREPANGLHIFNTDERCLNYYDSIYQIWNCYCESCQTVIINITSNVCKLDFYNTYGKVSPSKKYRVNITAGIVISGCGPGDTAISFNSMPFNAAVIINNYGTIAGTGGIGGNGTIEGSNCGYPYTTVNATPGGSGGHAISTKTGISIIINNYGIVASGGGGGGGSGGNTTGHGGGGGGGAGIVGGNSGIGGGRHLYAGFGGCPFEQVAQNGSLGQAITGGSGGSGVSGGATGGNGGNRGQAGQNGTGNLSNYAAGGVAGKAIRGGSGNLINNINGGQSFGAVDQ